MKSILKNILAFSLLGLVMALSSCDSDSDGDKKSDTEVDPRDKFIGSWNVEEIVGNDVPDKYTAVIDYATNSAYVKISNFYFVSSNDDPVLALVTGNTLTISNEESCDHTFNGSGSYKSGDEINFSYTVKTTTDEISVTATYKK